MRRARRSDLKRLATAVGLLEYRDVGSGVQVVFVHGALLNGGLWDDVAFYLPPDLRLIRPDLPLGGHRYPAATNADLTPPALARLLLDFIESLDLNDVILVGSDVGQTICELAVASDHRRARCIAGLLFTNCDAFDAYPPGGIVDGGGLDEEALESAAWSLTTRDGRKAFFRNLTWEPLPDDQLCELLGGFLEDADVRRDALRALGGLRQPRTFAAKGFEGPVKVLWGTEDSRLPMEVGAQLAAQFANAEFRQIPEARMLVPLDQPERVAEAILDLVEQRMRRR
jgi:pimeloyl-ACP methyl ester carboxylesterase